MEDTYRSIRELFFRPVTPTALLQAGWSGAKDVAQSQGVRKIPALQLSGDEAEQLSQFTAAFEELLAETPVRSRNAIAFAAAGAMTQSLHERHTYFLPPSDAQQVTTLTQGGAPFAGIGIELNTTQHPAIITDVFPQGPAAKAGLAPGDEIIAAGGHNLAASSASQITNALSGAVDSSLVLTVRTPQGNDKSVTLVRAIVHPPVVEHRLLAGGYCYVRLRSFPPADVVLAAGGTDVNEIRKALMQCDAQGATAWLLDLRGNPGGADVDRVAALFLTRGVVSTARDREGARYLLTPNGQPLEPELPLAVLINANSASSSEMLASAIQDEHRGTIVGTHSAGIVNGTELVPLPLGAVVGIAVEQILRGETNQPLDGTGVTPDVTVNPQSPTPKQLSQGVDNVILAAESALAHGPTAVPVPILEADPQLWSVSRVLKLLGPLLPSGATIDDHVAEVQREDLVTDTLSGYASGFPSLTQAEERGIRLGFQGAVSRRYGNVDDPDITVTVSHYRTAAGAHDDIANVYLPGEHHNPLEEASESVPVALGNETYFRVGTGPSSGLVDLQWRDGGYLFDVQHQGTPGDVPTARMVLVAERVAQLFQQQRAAGGLLHSIP
ncbi:MAG: S41 family peptidase [Chloroflexi bacterium]|nr:S41 family peptidase [Chloroflexota bacterium]